MPTELISDFDAIAKRYDVLTRLNPGYLAHLRWSAERLRLAPGARILDLCCGTGLSTAALLAVYPDAASITGLDASAGMLAVARAAAARPSLALARKNGSGASTSRTSRSPTSPHAGGPTVTFVLGDAMDPAAALPAGTPPFDGILMAYGIRNVPDRDLCLARLRALLAPGAPICFHEYSVADSAWSRAIWNTVAQTVIAPLGILATGNTRMWRYLRASVNAFDGVHAFEARLQRAGFVDIETLPMNGWQRGIVHSFLARAPRR